MQARSLFFAGIFLACGLSFLLGDSGLYEPETLPPTSSGFPDRPIRIVVYTSPGGMIDFTARKFAEVARQYTNVPFIVINKPGAGGVVAFEEVLQMPADGYTMLAVTRSNISKIIASDRDDLIDGVDWFAYVMDNPHVVITKKEDGFADWNALNQDALQRGGDQLWLGADIGGVKHVSGVKMWQASGKKARWIPYGSGGQAVAALMGGMGAAYLGNPSDVAGKDALQIVAVAATKRMEAFPEVPTFRELGIEGLENERIWRGFAFRKGLPEKVREWFEKLFQRVAENPEWVETWTPEGVSAEYKPAEEFQQIVEQDREEFRHYLKEMGLLREPGERHSFLAGLGQSPALEFLTGALVILNLLLGIYLLRSRHRMLFGELLILVFFFSVALVIFAVTATLPPSSQVDPIGAAGIPRLWIFLLIPLGLYQTWLILKEQEEKPSSQLPLLLLAILAALGVYVLLIPWTGYLLTTTLFIPVALRLMDYRNLPVTAVITVAWLCFAYFVFGKILFVALPTGRLFGG